MKNKKAQTGACSRQGSTLPVIANQELQQTSIRQHRPYKNHLGEGFHDPHHRGEIRKSIEGEMVKGSWNIFQD